MLHKLVSSTPPEYRLRYYEVPEEFREPGIFTGYRKPYCTLRQTIMSVFWPTNETFNFWSHFLAFWYFLAKTYGFYKDEKLISDHYHWPYLVYLATTCFWPLVSCTAHLFNILSREVRHVTFFFDYLALSWYSYGVATAYHAYASDRTFMESWLWRVYLYIAFAGALTCTLLACETRFMRYSTFQWTLRVFAFILPYFTSTFPLADRLARHFFGNGDKPIEDELAISYHRRQIMSAAIGIMAYGLHWPEAIFPGKFDLVGNSHQILHICGVAASYFQIWACYADMINRRRFLQRTSTAVTDRADATFAVIVFIADLVAIFIYTVRMPERIQENVDDKAK